MLRRPAALVLALLLLPIAGAALADDAAARKQVTQLYAKMDAAALKKDTKAFMALLAPNFTMVRHGGQKLSREQFASQLQQSMGPQTKVKTSVTLVKKIDVHGDKATVESVGKAVLIVQGSDGKTHELASSGPSRDTLVKKNGAWLVAETRETAAETATMDGKPLSVPQGTPPKPSRTTK